MTVLTIFTFSSHSTLILLLLSIFKIFFFFQKIHQLLREKRTFWEIAILAPHSTINLLTLAISKKQVFLQNRTVFIYKRGPLNVFRVFTVSVAFFGIFATFSKISKTGKIFQKPVSVSQKTQDLNAFRSPVVSVAFYSNLLHLPIFKKLKKIPKTHPSFKKTQKLNVLRSLIFFGRIPLRFCYF